MKRPGKNTPSYMPKEDIKRLLALPAAILLSALYVVSDFQKSPVQELILVGSALFITIVLFVVSGSFSACATSQVLTVIFILLYYVYRVFFMQTTFSQELSFMNIFDIGLLWFTGFAFAVCIRIFLLGKKDTKKRREDFRKAFRVSSIVFLAVYAMLLVWLFVSMRPIDMDGQRSLNLIPFQGAFAIYWPHIAAGQFRGEIFVQFFGNLLIFTPLGFFLYVFGKKIPGAIRIATPFVLAGVIEATQYFLNTGKSDIDDFWMNVVGYFLGVLVYFLLGFIRRTITHGEEKHIF